MSQLVIEVESTDLETRQKKAGGTYQVQTGYVHTLDRGGKIRRYPEQFNIFPPRDDSGNAIPFKVGKYSVSAQSFRVNNGFLELGFLQLEPIK